MSKEIKRNLAIIIIIAVVIGGYAFFFLSPRIFRESKENLLNTEIGREVKAGSGFSVVVEDWQYCKAEQSMAVIFSFKNSNSKRYCSTESFAVVFFLENYKILIAGISLFRQGTAAPNPWQVYPAITV